MIQLIDAGYTERGERVGVQYHPVDLGHERLSGELEEIVDHRVEEKVTERVWEALTRFCAEVIDHQEPRLTVGAFCFASGMHVMEGVSMTSFAEKLGYTRAALSHRVVQITKQLGLPPSRYMKREDARETYKQTRIKVAAR